MDGTFTFPELGSESALPHINVSKKFLGAWTSDQRIALRPNCHPNQRNLPVERSMRVTVTIRQHRSGYMYSRAKALGIICQIFLDAAGGSARRYMFGVILVKMSLWMDITG